MGVFKVFFEVNLQLPKPRNAPVTLWPAVQGTTTDMKKCGVIILNWNGVDLLRRFLPEAARCTIDSDTDLIVADNGSTDGSLQWVAENHPDVLTIDLGENHGFARGYNLAIGQVDYPFVVLLNSDVRVTPGWVRPLLGFMEKTPSAGACQPKIRWLKHPELFEYAGAAGGLIDRNGYPYCRGRVMGSLEEDRGQYDSPGKPVPVAWASGAAMMVRTALYRELGGLDELFFAHMEEIDLCCRMARHGYGVYAVTDSTVYHVGGASLGKENPRKTYLNFRNNLLLLHKNMPPRQGRRLLFRRRLLDTLAWARFVALFKWRHAAAILRAHNDFRHLRRRYTDMPDTDFLHSLPGADRNILLDHYLRRKTQ